MKNLSFEKGIINIHKHVATEELLLLSRGVNVFPDIDKAEISEKLAKDNLTLLEALWIVKIKANRAIKANSELIKKILDLKSKMKKVVNND